MHALARSTGCLPALWDACVCGPIPTCVCIRSSSRLTLVCIPSHALCPSTGFWRPQQRHICHGQRAPGNHRCAKWGRLCWAEQGKYALQVHATGLELRSIWWPVPWLDVITQMRPAPCPLGTGRTTLRQHPAPRASTLRPAPAGAPAGHHALLVRTAENSAMPQKWRKRAPFVCCPSRCTVVRSWLRMPALLSSTVSRLRAQPVQSGLLVGVRQRPASRPPSAGRVWHCRMQAHWRGLCGAHAPVAYKDAMHSSITVNACVHVCVCARMHQAAPRRLHAACSFAIQKRRVVPCTRCAIHASQARWLRHRPPGRLAHACEQRPAHRD